MSFPRQQHPWNEEPDNETSTEALGDVEQEAVQPHFNILQN